MRKLVFALLLAAVSGGAAAAWVSVGENDKGATYADTETMHKTADNLVRMWHLRNLKTAGKQPGIAKPYLSEKNQDEYDCKVGRHRPLYISFYSGPMGTGDIIYGDTDDGKWRPLAPESIAESLWKFACGRN